MLGLLMVPIGVFLLQTVQILPRTWSFQTHMNAMLDSAGFLETATITL